MPYSVYQKSYSFLCPDPLQEYPYDLTPLKRTPLNAMVKVDHQSLKYRWNIK
ncbi:hypothetical protein [Sphingobacterium psychroaquaticum]|uniref:Uncharacterized protein n=1 Tax=Sphingobacterium psychroaquaticum TaxID=561061 RepID=A0A1X7HXB2_9SPHI|nr:hypothetical protein [Sphingobacterium psychroaquaticum]SMG06079.1 hypothetical protein SAMN05660862_0115 [Sphingobacterium psychroaquaticum]